jgi:uroporphyrinogen decarboxylase
MVTPRFLGITDYAEFFRNGEAMAEAQIKAWQRYGHDVLMIENGTAALAEACGVQVEYLKSSAPVAKKPAISSLDEVDKLIIPDPYKDPLLRELLKAGEFLLDLALGKNLEKIHQLLDFCRKASELYVVAQIEQGAHATSIGDSPSGPDVISPQYYRDYAYPYVKKLVSNIKKKDITLAYHICGNSTPIIEDMVSTGATIIEIDQKADQQVSKSAAAGKATLLGPIDPSEVMAHGTPELVMEKCNEALENLSPGGGFILGPGCALSPDTPDENIDAMIEASKKFSPQ